MVDRKGGKPRSHPVSERMRPDLPTIIPRYPIIHHNYGRVREAIPIQEESPARRRAFRPSGKRFQIRFTVTQRINFHRVFIIFLEKFFCNVDRTW